MPTSELIAPYRCPAVLARKAASARARPGRTCRARRCVLRGQNFVDCPSPSRRAARSPRPSGDSGFAQLAVPSGPRPKPSSRRRGARPAWPHPCQSPRGHAHLRSAPFRVAFAVRLWISPLPAAGFIFQDGSCPRRSAFPAVTVKFLWTLKSSVLFLDPAPEIRYRFWK